MERKRIILALTVCVACVVVVLGYILLLDRRLGDSREPRFADAADRVEWIAERIRGGPPTPILDAHFLENVHRYEHTHMGPAWSMYTLYARIEVPPGSGLAWAARTKPHHRGGSDNLFGDRAAVPWGADPGDLDGAAWYLPQPLFGKEGSIAVSADGSKVFVYLVRR